MDNFMTGFILLALASSGIQACEVVPEVVSCDSTDQVFITENNTHIVTSNTSAKFRFVIPKKPGVYQIKLDYIAFERGDADAVGDCTGDIMTISGAKTVKGLSVCGNLTGQHSKVLFRNSVSRP